VVQKIERFAAKLARNRFVKVFIAAAVVMAATMIIERNGAVDMAAMVKAAWQAGLVALALAVLKYVKEAPREK
jgi:uncharacterized membrane protein YjjP (DUF1212 family)